MIREIFTPIPVRRNSLYCVWIATGNPAQPLIRVWIDREMRVAGSGNANNLEAYSRCA